ncbi:hypothetical protein AERO9AM_20247 [Aeromicrobium sp. 9AM]|nr:hypothetical protein AERO9AM_20247 [Aeromicrobium sp. 9AM]
MTNPRADRGTRHTAVALRATADP